MEELTKKLQTIRPTSPHQLIAETPSHQDEGNSFDSTPLKGSPANMAESLENDQVASNEQPILDIPRLVRQFTSPNDEGTSESPLVVSDEIDAAEDKSQDDSDIFSSDGESTHGDDVSKSNHEPPNFGSPIRTRQQAEDKFPQLLTSLQKKLLMVRQTSLEVSETFDRLSSPSKKSQNRPNYASFQLLESDLKNDESDDEPVDADTNDKTETPYRPVALFRDLNDEGDETKLPESTPNLTDSSLPENDNPSNTSIQQSPVVVLYDNVSTKSPLPLVAAPSTISSSQNDNHPTNSTTSTPQQKESRMSQSSRASCESDLSQHVLKEGFLMKRGFINKAFQRRWCVLKGKDIYYYKQYRDKDVRGKINCSQALVVRAENRKDELPFAFYIHTPQDRYINYISMS